MYRVLVRTQNSGPFSQTRSRALKFRFSDSGSGPFSRPKTSKSRFFASGHVQYPRSSGFFVVFGKENLYKLQIYLKKNLEIRLLKKNMDTFENEVNLNFHISFEVLVWVYGWDSLSAFDRRATISVSCKFFEIHYGNVIWFYQSFWKIKLVQTSMFCSDWFVQSSHRLNFWLEIEIWIIWVCLLNVIHF